MNEKIIIRWDIVPDKDRYTLIRNAEGRLFLHNATIGASGPVAYHGRDINAHAGKIMFDKLAHLAEENITKDRCIVGLQEKNAAMEKVGTELEKYLNELAEDVIKFNIDHAVEAHVEDEMAKEWEEILNKAKEVTR